jgi:hypothetical protein
MNPAKTKPVLAVVPTEPPTPAVDVQPSETTRALIEQRDALNERIAAEQQRDRAIAEVVALVQRLGLGHRDLLKIAKLLKPGRGGRAARSRMRIGFVEPDGVPIKGKAGKAMVAGRRAKNLSRSQLASLMGVVPQLIQQWEIGRNVPGPGMRARLAKALGMSPDRFAGTD